MVPCKRTSRAVWTIPIDADPDRPSSTPPTIWKRCARPSGYAAHLFQFFAPHVGRRVLEVGCGIGTMSRRLADVADVVVGIEPNAHCAGLVREEMRGEPKFSLRTCHLEECDLGRARRARLRHGLLHQRARAHRGRPRRAAHVSQTRSMPGGRVLVWVPAVQAAYGPLDAELGHYRRYSKASLGRGVRGGRARPADAALLQSDWLAWVDVQRARPQDARPQPGAGARVRHLHRSLGAAAANGCCRRRSACRSSRWGNAGSRVPPPVRLVTAHALADFCRARAQLRSSGW